MKNVPWFMGMMFCLTVSLLVAATVAVSVYVLVHYVVSPFIWIPAASALLLTAILAPAWIDVGDWLIKKRR